MRHSICLILALLVLATPARAELQWTKPIQQFQVTPDQKSVEAHFAFKNVGTAAVTIKSLTPSCGCTTAHLEKKTYQAGEQGEVVAKYSFPFQKGSLRKTIAVTTDDRPNEPVTLDIRVLVNEPFDVKPGLVYWRTGEAAEPKSVQLVAHALPVHVKGVTSSNPRLVASCQTVKPGMEYTVSVKPADTTQKETGEITVLTDFPADAPRSYTIHARIK